jgi:hypothetical protein
MKGAHLHRLHLYSAISFLFLFAATSCKKDTIQYTFQGVVSETVNQQPISEADIAIFQKPFNNSITSAYYELAGSSTSNSNGIFDLTFDRTKVTEFLIEISKEGYFGYESLLNSDEVSSDEINLISAKLDSKSWIEFDIENVPPNNITDDFTMIFYNYRPDCEECATSDYNYMPGIVDTTFRIVSTAGQYFNFTYIDVESGNSYHDSIFMTPFDTTNYSIVY